MLLGAGMALALTTHVAAQELIDGSDVEAIVEVARNYGEADLSRTSDGNPMIEGKMDGILYQVFFLNCTKGKRCEDINFYAGFTDLRPTLEEINDWNANKRFGRAYIDDVKDPNVEMDVDLVAGVTVDYIDSQFSLWKLVLTQFMDHIGY
jgi:hypothetical protein